MSREVGKKRQPTRQDRLMAEWIGAGRKAGVAYLKAKVLDANSQRLLRTLEPFEMDGLVCAVMEAVDAQRLAIGIRDPFTLENALKEFDAQAGDSLDGVFPPADTKGIFE